MRDRADIRARHGAGGTVRGIARETGASRNAVRRAIDPTARERYHRASMAEEYEPAVRDVLADWPRLSVEEIGRIVEWPGSRRTLSTLVARLRPLALEREAENLNRPALGHARTGRRTMGRLTSGRMNVGVLHGRQAEDPHHPA